uniref:calcium-binding mitochondrial carrier protein SCaMC-2-like n=1 Tax=Myxine glutinosa TaxID=7769 RepID=UPI00358FCBD8
MVIEKAAEALLTFISELVSSSAAGRGDRQRLARLFYVLDVNRDGWIDAGDLAAGVALLGVSRTDGELMQILKAGDANKDGLLDFEEFVSYLKEHEKNLKLAFKSLDSKKDGRIDAAELAESLMNLGVHITLQQAEKILC